MDNCKLIDRNFAKPDIVAYGSRVQKTLFKTGKKRKFIYTVTDFPISDPWSQSGLRPAIKKLARMDFFKGPIMELGIGDGRNIFLTGREVTEVIGIDVEEWRLTIAKYNLSNDPFFAKIPVFLFKADAVFFLDRIREKLKNKEIKEMPKRVIMILPQSLGGNNTADRYKTRLSYQKYEKKWGRYGLALNSAVLGKLQEVLAKSAEIILVLSGRIPEEIRLKMIESTGWKIKETVINAVVQQDPDTTLNWMIGNVPDSGNLFQDKNGNYLSISEAVKRVKESGGKRSKLDLYHRLFVYRLVLAKSVSILLR